MGLVCIWMFLLIITSFIYAKILYDEDKKIEAAALTGIAIIILMAFLIMISRLPIF